MTYSPFPVSADILTSGAVAINHNVARMVGSSVMDMVGSSVSSPIDKVGFSVMEPVGSSVMDMVGAAGMRGCLLDEKDGVLSPYAGDNVGGVDITPPSAPVAALPVLNIMSPLYNR